MKTSLLLLPLLMLAWTGSAQDSPDSSKAEKPRKISATQAQDHLEETLIVTGNVAQTSIREKIVYLNLDQGSRDVKEPIPWRNIDLNHCPRRS